MFLAGPFFIHCATSGDLCLYWAVDESHRVMASKKENASKFYIKPSDNPKHPEEFYICYYDANISELQERGNSYKFDEAKEFVEPIPRYLMTPTDAFGRNSGPLKLKYQMRSRDSRLSLVSCIRKHHQPPVSLSEWMSGREICFIQCARRKHMKGYIAVMRNVVYWRYETCCVHSKHNEDESMSFMLFQTVRTLETRTDKAVKAAAQDCFFPSQIPIQVVPYSIESCIPSRVARFDFPSESNPLDLVPVPVLEPVPTDTQLPVLAPLPQQSTERPLSVEEEVLPTIPPVKPPLPLSPKPSADLLLQAEVMGTENSSDYDSVYSSDTNKD